jgi:hypothetical protein
VFAEAMRLKAIKANYGSPFNSIRCIKFKSQINQLKKNEFAMQIYRGISAIT